MHTSYEVPYIPKKQISLIVIGDAHLETISLRGVLERFNYRVEVHWVASRIEALKILCGSIQTFPYVILSCHGDECGGILIPDEPIIGIDDLAISLPGQVVINLGCGTGQDNAAARYLSGGCCAYIAPCEAVEGNTALLFAIHLFYYLEANQSLTEAFSRAKVFDNESGLFKCWQPVDIGKE